MGSSAPVSFIIADITATSCSELAPCTRRTGPLFIGASRTGLQKRWVLGSTLDRVIARADDLGVPVVVYAQPTGLRDRASEALFPVSRYVRSAFR